MSSRWATPAVMFLGTKIEIFNGKPNTVNYLAQLMGVASANIWNSYDPSPGQMCVSPLAATGRRITHFPNRAAL